MEDEHTGGLVSEAEFARDLAELGADPLRKKYKKEANCHANIKQRCKKGDFDLDPEWNDFRSFLRDMGPCPTADGSIDRINSDLHRYGPNLVRWATKKQQTANRRNTRWIVFRGEQITLNDFAVRIGVPYSTVHSALGRGETPEQIAGKVQQAAAPVGYRPLRVREDQYGEWRAEYERWYRRVPRSKRNYALPEVFDLLVISAKLVGAEKRMEAGGFYELSPDEYARDAGNWIEERRIVSSAPSWKDHAIRALAARNPKLARSFMPSPGRTEHDALRYAKWIEQPDDEPRSNRHGWSDEADEDCS